MYDGRSNLSPAAPAAVLLHFLTALARPPDPTRAQRRSHSPRRRTNGSNCSLASLAPRATRSHAPGLNSGEKPLASGILVAERNGSSPGFQVLFCTGGYVLIPTRRR